LGVGFQRFRTARQRSEHPDLTETVVDAIREGLRPHVTDDGVLLPSGTWIVTARRP